MKTNYYKRILRNLILTTCFIVIGNNLQAQISFGSNCPNSDFMYEDFTNWSGCYGKSTNPCDTIGFVTTSTLGRPSRHTIITPQSINYPNGNIDSLTRNNGSFSGLLKIPTGINQVVRLGNWNANSEAERLIYDITVDTNNNGFFVCNFAAVLENPNGGIPLADMPKFTIKILNSAGIPFPDTVARFMYYPTMPNFIPDTAHVATHTVLWYNWKTLTFNLKPYQGQHIKIEFTTNDCASSAYFGYAYFYASCQSRNINIEYCPSSSIAKLTAINGFKYKWLPSGDTNQTIKIANPVDSTIYKCVITSPLNSFNQDTLTVVLIQNKINSNFNFSNSCVNSPITFVYASTSNTPIYSWYWDFGDPGSAGNHMNMGTIINHNYLNSGTYYVRLIDSLLTGCPDTMIKAVTIYPQPHADFYWNPVFPVPGSLVSFGNLTSPIDTNYQYDWIFGDGNTSNLMYPNHTFTSIGNYNLNLIVMSDYGCVDTISNTIHITGVGINENTLKDVKVVMDNSFQMLMISNLSLNSTITIYDITGKHLLSHTSNQYLKVDMSKYAKGIYTVNIMDANGSITKKIIKE